MDRFLFADRLSEIPFPELADHCAHILCLAGSAAFSYGDRPFALRARQVAVVGSPERVADVRPDRHFRCLAFVASHRFLEARLPANHFGIGGSISLWDDPIIDLSADDTARLRDDLLALGRRIDRRGCRFGEEALGAAALTLMYDLFEVHAARGGSVYASDRALYVVRSLMELLATGVSERCRSVAELARRLHVSPKYLSDTVRRQTGRSVTHYIDAHTLPILRRHLDDPSLSVAMISERMGFSSPAYFARYVRRLLGVSPKAWRGSRVPASKRELSKK